MSDVTLEDAAGFLETDHDCCPGRHCEAALVRAAAKVVEEARRHSCEQHLAGTTTIHCRMCEALAAFDEVGK
jgi:hypothetical protein